MIYTVTFNPSIDYVIQVEEFKVGTVNRVCSDRKYAGGKGINVSRVLNNLGIKSKALGFIGGFTGKFIEDSLKKDGVYTDFIEIEGDTRINVKLKSGEETEINGAGPDIKERDIKKLFEKIKSLTCGDYIVLAGNVQKSLPKDIYSRIQQEALDSDVKVIVDTTGTALTATLKYKPFLIKPNIHELGDIFNVEIKEFKEAAHYGEKLRNMGVENVIISMGGDGALLICKEGVYHASSPKGIVKNSVGAGDSLVAGFLAEYSRSSKIIEAFKYGTAAGSATAFSMDLCQRKDVEKLISEINIIKL